MSDIMRSASCRIRRVAASGKRRQLRLSVFSQEWAAPRHTAFDGTVQQYDGSNAPFTIFYYLLHGRCAAQWMPWFDQGDAALILA